MNSTLARALLCLALLAGTKAINAAEALSLEQLAGEFCFGDGVVLNARLLIDPDGTFTFKWTGCMGAHQKSSGPAAFENGILKLTPQKSNDKKALKGTPTEFLAVPWGARLYLVP